MSDEKESKGLPLVLPAMLGEQYFLSSILKKTPDKILYLAQQKDIRRNVYVESLRHEVLGDDAKVAFFLESARAKSRHSFKFIGLSLELLFHNDTWHLIYEKIQGEPLDKMIATGSYLTPSRISEFLLNLCHICIFMDIEGVATEPFSLERCYLMDHDFRMDNPAIAGQRKRSTSRIYLHDAVMKIEPLLEKKSPHAEALLDILRRMRYLANWETITPMLFAEELAQFQLRVLLDA